MKILVVNAGSSSLKYQLVDMENEHVLAKGNCERIGIDGKITHKTSDGYKVSKDINFPTHTEAFHQLVKELSEGEHAVVSSMSEISAVGHRLVHGGEKFCSSVLITDEVIDAVTELYPLAPLHNPANVLAVKACQATFGDSIPQVGVFDTAFHQTMPAKAYTFGVPYEYYEKYHVRRYGFHGTSHRFVSGRYGEIDGGLEGKKIVTCHLGNGSSISAIKDGKVLDTSMGFTPLDGIIMGTRSGGVDPSVITFIQEKEGLSPKETSDLLNKKSGFLGLSGTSSDARDIDNAAAKGNYRAQLTNEIVCYQIKKYIGGYAAAMGGLDAVIFTGGMGENSKSLRANVCADMEFLGMKLDTVANKEKSGSEAKISTSDSKVNIYIIPTDEELLIARDTKEIVSNL